MATAATLQDGDILLVGQLQHFAGARTNPYVVQVAHQICRNFKLSIKGQRNLNKSLNNLPCLSALDQRLTVGWSFEHAIRNPRVHEIGYEHLTLLISFAECFHEEYAAEVFHHFAQMMLPEDQITPHIGQWKDVLHFCNGILASDEFGLLVESLINLDPYSITPGGQASPERCIVPAAAFAGVLIAISEMLTGQRDHLTVRGGGVIGYVAALCEYFYDLTVVIESSTGERLYGSTDHAQVNCVYTNKREIFVDDGTKMAEVTKQMSHISVEEQAYPTRIHFFPFGGRNTWQTLLPQVFGHTFHKLEHEYSKHMFTAIGSAFRAIEAAGAARTAEERRELSNTLQNPPPDPSASQVITDLLAYLPSLQRGTGRIERQLRLSPEEACRTHLKSIDELSRLCHCRVCAQTVLSPTNSQPNPSSNKQASDIPSPSTTGYCLPSIVEGIIALALVLSRLVLAFEINPSREGIQLLYAARVAKFASTDRNLLAPKPSDIADIYDNIPWESTPKILRHACKVFAGGHLPIGSLPKNTVAVAHEGICAFVAEFMSGKGVRRDLKGMIRVVNGGIGIRQKAFKRACYGDKPEGRKSWVWEEAKLSHFEDSLWLM